jgi:hypothetical protein
MLAENLFAKLSATFFCYFYFIAATPISENLYKKYSFSFVFALGRVSRQNRYDYIMQFVSFPPLTVIKSFYLYVNNFGPKSRYIRKITNIKLYICREKNIAVNKLNMNLIFSP